PKPRLNAPFWALAPASWMGLATGTLLPLSRSVSLRLANSVVGLQRAVADHHQLASNFASPFSPQTSFAPTTGSPPPRA
ncbi:hypothetical protein C6A85_72460, partial [Mycobacterium sp. ITM-2017-0098]